MNYVELTIQILDKLNLFWDDLAYNKQNKITYGDLVLSLLENRSMLKASKALGVSERTLERVMPEALHPLVGNGDGFTNSTPWKYQLLALLGIKHCPVCNQDKLKELFYNNKSKKCIECEKEHSKEYAIKNPDKIIQYRKAYYTKNHSKELLRLIEYKHSRAKRVPSWYHLEKVKIEEFYRKCPTGYHVDHIIPLHGKLVSGLHTLANLQYLSAKDNISKGNSYTIE